MQWGRSRGARSRPGRGLLLATLIAVLIAHVPLTHAQSSATGVESWPSKPIRIIINGAAGTATDVVGRMIGQKLGERLKQPVVIDNRTGAIGNIAIETAARAAPDGYHLFYSIPSVAINPHLYPMAVDPMTDLAPVVQAAAVTFTLIAHPDFAPRTVPEIVTAAKAKPGAVSCAWAGPSPHFACALLRLRSGADINVVSYKSQSLALNDVIGGHVNLMFEVTNVAAAQARAGRVRPLATINPARGSGPFAELPTVSETYSGFEFVTWQGVFVPVKTPRPIIERLNREIGAIMDDAEVRKRLTDGGLTPAAGTVAAFDALVKRDHELFGRIIREAGIKPE